MYYCNKCGHMGANGPMHYRRGGGTCGYDAVLCKEGDALTLQEIANTVAQFLPLGYTLSLRPGGSAPTQGYTAPAAKENKR